MKEEPNAFCMKLTVTDSKYKMFQKYLVVEQNSFQKNIFKQAGAELCQAQVKLGLAKIKISFHLI